MQDHVYERVKLRMEWEGGCTGTRMCSAHSEHHKKVLLSLELASALTNDSLHLWKDTLYYILGCLNVGQDSFPRSYVQLKLV